VVWEEGAREGSPYPDLVHHRLGKETCIKAMSIYGEATPKQ